MSIPPSPSEERFARIVDDLLHYPEVTFGSSEKKSFGSSALKIQGEIFAMISSKYQASIHPPGIRANGIIDCQYECELPVPFSR